MIPNGEDPRQKNDAKKKEGSKSSGEGMEKLEPRQIPERYRTLTEYVMRLTITILFYITALTFAAMICEIGSGSI